jgi:hypothetical protein
MDTRTYNLGNAVFHFFHIAGKQPMAVLWIALWQALLTGGLTYLAWLTLGDFYIWMFQLAASGAEPSETEMLARMGGVMAMVPLISLGGIVIALMAQGAWLRLLTRQEIAAVFPFRLGGDELRLLATNLGLIAIGIGAYFAFSFLMVIAAFGAAAVFSEGGDAAAGVAAGLVVGIGLLAFLVIAVFLSVRLSAAPALTVLEKRIAFPAWGATKGVFWPVLGGYILTAIIIFILSFVVGGVVNFALLGAIWPVLGEFMELAQAGYEPEPEEVLAIFAETLSSAGTITALVAAGLLSVLMRSFLDAIWHGVGAYTALSLQPRPAEDARG